MKVRRAKLEDFEQINKISTQVHNVHVKLRPDVFKKVDNSMDGRFEKLLEEEIILVIEEKEILGYALCMIRDTSPLQQPSRRFCIEEFGIEENSRRKGVGRIFFEEIKNFAKKENCNEIILTAYANNINALEFYKCMGFTERSVKLEMKI